jgi:RHS repeat-associated protein
VDRKHFSQLNSSESASSEKTSIAGAVPVTVNASEHGHAQASINFEALPAGNGFVPKLSLEYASSQTNMGLGGIGWELGGISVISRCQKHRAFEGSQAPILLDQSDSICLNGTKLLLIDGDNLTEGSVYRPYLDDFKKITMRDGFFELKTRSGELWYFGRSTASRELSGVGAATSWYLDRIQDRSGNIIDYEYFEDGRRLFLKRLRYGGNVVFNKPSYRSLILNYEKLPVGVERFVAGQSYVSQQLLKSVDASHEDKSIWTYYLNHSLAGQAAKLSLDSVQQCFQDKACFPKTTFAYEGGTAVSLKESSNYKLPEFTPVNNPVWAPEKSARVFADLNNDGRTDILGVRKDAIVFSLADHSGMGPVVEKPRADLFMWDPRFDMISLNDINRDGYLDIVLFSQDSVRGGVYVAYWTGESFSDFKLWTEKFGKKWSVRDHFRIVSDFNGDGWADIAGIRDDGVYLMINKDGVLQGGDQPVLADFGVNAGWRRDQNPRYFIDMNNDGLLDILGLGKKEVKVALGTGNGFAAPTTWLNGFGFDRYYNSDNLPRMLADMNADGLVDLVGFHLDGVYVSLNNGKSLETETRWLDGLYFSKGWNGQNNTKRMIVDINKDGFPDFIGFRFSGLEVYFGQGAPINGQSPTIFPQFSSLLRPWKASEQQIEFEDIDSNAFSELTIMLRQGTWSTEIKADPVRLKSIEDALGNKTDIDYGLLTNPDIYKKTRDPVYPLVSVDGTFPVVKSIQTSNGIGGSSKVSYRYVNGAFHSEGFGFIGFEKRVVTDHTSGTVTVESYSQNTKKLMHGSLESVEVSLLLNPERLVSKTQSDYETKCFDDHALHCVVLEVNNTSSFYDEAGSLSHSVVVSKQYDSFLNPILLNTKTTDKFGTYTTQIDSQYLNNSGTWDIGILKTTKSTYKSDSLGTSTQPVTKSTEFAYDLDGRLIAEIQEPDSPLWIKKEYHRTRNGYGLVDEVVTSWGVDHGRGLDFKEVTRRVDYDTQGFVENEFNALLHRVSHVRSPETGLLVSSTDPNGLKTQFTYDPAMRMASAIEPDGKVTTVTRSFCDSSCPNNAVLIEKTTVSGFGESIQYFDAKARVVRSVKSLSEKQKSVEDNVYNEKGLLTKKSKPYFFDQSPKHWIFYGYDDRNRQTIVSLPGGAVYETRYTGLQTIQIDALDRQTITQRDSRGLVRSLTNVKQETIQYEYDAAGRLTAMIDAGRNRTEMAYDVFDRRTSLLDPATGVTETTYNALGLVATENQNSTKQEPTYDALGRPLTVSTTRSGSEPIVESFTYDQSRFGLGKISEAIGPNSKIEYSYDNVSRLIGTTHTILGKTYHTSTEYDFLGRVGKVGYPSGFAVTYAYDAASRLTGISDHLSGKSYWKLVDILPNGDVKQSSLGNGAQVFRTQNEETDRIIGETVLGTDNSLQMARAYEHDLMGNLITRTDATTGIKESFGYDGLNRLESFTGADAKPVSLRYDAIGRIVERSDLGSYEYGKGCEGGSSSPFAIKKVGDKTFCTDALGNVTKSGDRSLIYNAKNLPLEIRTAKSQVRYQYGLGSAVLSKEEKIEDEITRTLFVGQSYEEEMSPAGRKQKHYVGDFLIVETGDSSRSENYLYTDYLGSTLAVADQNGTLSEKFDYDPFGQRRSVTSLEWIDGFKPKATSRGFTGHNHADSVNLVHMKGRMYDPTIGLFMSPDPYIQDPTRIQNLNRYSYVLNNPLSYTDPSGFMFKGIDRMFGHGLRGAAEVLGNSFLAKQTSKAGVWLSNGNNQRMVAAIAISVAGTVLGGPGYLAITGYGQMAAYSAAVGYTSSYVASNGDKKAALNGAVTGAAFSLVGSAFELAKVDGRLSSGMMVAKVIAHGAVGGLSSVANGGRFESGFLSSGLSQAAGQYGVYEALGAKESAQGWQIAHNAVVAAVIGGSISEVSGGSFEQAALTSAVGRLFNDLKHSERRITKVTLWAKIDGANGMGHSGVSFSFSDNTIDYFEKYPTVDGATFTVNSDIRDRYNVAASEFYAKRPDGSLEGSWLSVDVDLLHAERAHAYASSEARALEPYRLIGNSCVDYARSILKAGMPTNSVVNQYVNSPQMIPNDFAKGLINANSGRRDPRSKW